MSSSLARTRSLRKPTQGSSTDLPPTTATSVSSSASITAARGPASSTTGGAAAAPSASASTSHRPVSPSRLPAPRSLAATRPTTRTVSGVSVASSTAAAATTASEAPKKKRPNPLSSLLSRSSSTRQPASVTTSISTRQRDVVAGAGAGGGLASSGPISAPLSRTSALSGLTRTTSTREPGLTRTRYPANASTSNLSLVSSSNAAAGRTGAGSGPSTPTTARPTTSGGLPSSRRAGAPTTTSTGAAATAVGAGSPTKGHARARSVATLNNSTVLRPPSQTSSTGATGAAPRSRPTSLYGAPPTSSYPSSTASTTTRPRPPSATDRLSSKPSVSSLSSATTTTSTRTARAGSTTTAPTRQPLKQPQKPPPSHQAATTAPPHLARQQAQQRQPSPTSPPRTTKPVLRPAFSTLQQHYSPAKSLAPKPLTATYLAAPSPSKLPANIALTAETSRLQTELLQLHLLHRDLPQVTSQWHASARSKLAARHADLAASARSLAALESDAAERRNLAALSSWGASTGKSGKAVTSSLPLEDRIQRLDALLTSLWSLDDPGGKHHRLVRAFERWASSLADLEAARARAEDGADPSALLDDNADVRFGGGLDARWKDDAAALVRRLEGWDAQLRELEYRGDDDEDAAYSTTTTQASSLKRMLDGCSSLVRDMLDELAVMEDIEAAAVQRENEWIKKMNREGDDGRGRDTQRAGAIWRVI
ncbi:hypothetical protein CSPX01_09981 [Colletotrichum filicis]|nr:hypothetical protein CSPX01_09981 [Colletotrichum filicis]